MENDRVLDMKQMAEKLDTSVSAIQIRTRQLAGDKGFKPKWNMKEGTATFDKVPGNQNKKYVGTKQAEKYVCMCDVGGDVVPIHVYAVNEEHAIDCIKQDFAHISKIISAIPVEEYKKSQSDGFRNKSSNKLGRLI